MRTFLLLFLLSTLPWAIGCKNKTKKPSSGHKKRFWSQKKKAKPVHAARLRQGTIESKLSGTTTLTAEHNVTVVTQVNGLVVRVYGKEGRSFRKGALLASLSNPYLRIAYNNAKLQVQKLERELKRNQKLLRKGYVSKQTAEELHFQLAQAKNQLKRAAEDQRNLRIRATIPGIVTKQHIRKGAWVSPQKPAFHLETPSSLVAIISVPEKNYPKLKKGLLARIRAEAFGDQISVTGRVIQISPTVDPKTGTIAVTIGKLTPRKMLRSGMFLTVSLILEQRKQAILVPKQAVQYTKNRPFVFRLQGRCPLQSLTGNRRGLIHKRKVKSTPSSKNPCKAQKVFFKKGLENSTHIEAENFLQAQDQVVTLGQQGLQNGSSLRIIKLTSS